MAWLLHVQSCECQTLDGRSDLHLHEHGEATLQENQYKSHLPPNGGHINFPTRLLYQNFCHYLQNGSPTMSGSCWNILPTKPGILAPPPPIVPSTGRVTVFSMGDSDLFRACRSKERKLLHKPFVELRDVVHQEHDITKSNHFRMISCTNHVLFLKVSAGDSIVSYTSFTWWRLATFPPYPLVGWLRLDMVLNWWYPPNACKMCWELYTRILPKGS